jgi:FixJ family two-component response regulator
MKELVPTVIMVDDDEAVRKSSQLILKSVGLPVAGYASAQEFLSHYVADQPGCLISEVRMANIGGLELQQELNRRGAMIPLIFLTAHADVSVAVLAMRHGAFHFLTKPCRDQALIGSVHRALATDRARRNEIRERDRLLERHKTLTVREREVLKLVTSGTSNKIAAADLGVSQRTIEIHRSRVMEKMQADSLPQLVRMTLEIGVIGGLSV